MCGVQGHGWHCAGVAGGQRVGVVGGCETSAVGTLGGVSARLHQRTAGQLGTLAARTAGLLLVLMAGLHFAARAQRLFGLQSAACGVQFGFFELLGTCHRRVVLQFF